MTFNSTNNDFDMTGGMTGDMTVDTNTAQREQASEETQVSETQVSETQVSGPQASVQDGRSKPRTSDVTSSGKPRKQYTTKKKKKEPTVAVAFRLDTPLYESALKCAEELHMSFSKFVRVAIQDYIAQHAITNEGTCPVVAQSVLSAYVDTDVDVTREFEVEPQVTAISVPQSRFLPPDNRVLPQFVASISEDLLAAFGIPVPVDTENAGLTDAENDIESSDVENLDREDHNCFGENYVSALAESLLDFDDTDDLEDFDNDMYDLNEDLEDFDLDDLLGT